MSKDDQIYFAVTVSKRRAEYLFKCLSRELCAYCDRELDECEADPCDDRRIAAGELAYCVGCKELFDPAALFNHFCDECYNRIQSGEEEEEARMQQALRIQIAPDDV